MNYAIRIARREDEQIVYELACQLAPVFIVNRIAFNQSYDVLLNDSCAYLYVVESDKMIVGYLLGWAHRAFFANGAVA